ncbi:nSTAND1 domain-containing NTPase [Streptomyces sp. NPDC001700]
MGRPEKPIDPQDGPTARFAHELRKLRDKAGAPGYRSMARHAGYSAATLSQAAGGDRLPTLPVALAYAKACGGDQAEWEQRWHTARDEEAAQPQATDEESADPPYRGLARFEPSDSARFFGRTRLTDNLTALTGAHRCVMVLGPSGSGKSSLLRAGLIPRLQDTEDPALRPAAIRILTPGPRPVHDHQKLFTPSAGGGDTWLVVDQFEEVFTLCRDVAERQQFISLLLSAQDPGSRLRIVVGVRADFYARCLQYEGLAAVLGEASLPVGPMTPEELREVIVKPAAAEGLIVERTLTARLIEEAGQEPGELPLTSHALLETWRRRRGRALTLEGYEAAGGIHGAIAQTAETLYTQLSPPQAEAARRILLRMISPGEGTPDTRRPVDQAELTTTRADPDADTVLHRLANTRLVILDNTTVDLAHEALITAWPRLRGWIEDSRERLRRHRRLTEAARNWHNRGCDSGALLRGVELAEAEDAFHTSEHRGELTAREADFLRASTAANQWRTRRTHLLVGTLSVLLLLALGATTVAVQKTAAADTQRRLAVSRELGARAGQVSEQSPEEAMILALQGYQQAPTREARSSLLSSYARFYANQFTGHTKTVTGTAFAPNGRILATASDDHSVKLWDTRSHHLLATLTGHTDSVNAVAFSPDSRILATASDDHSVKLWDTRSHHLLATLTGHTGLVDGAVFSPDGRSLATASRDRTVRLWDARTHQQRALLTGHTDPVTYVAFSPDGHTVASADGGRTTRLWDVASRKTLAVLAGHTGAVATVAFSPDGRTLATAGNDHSVKLWDVQSHRLLATLSGHTNMVLNVAFSPDGRTLASTSMDGTIRLWRPQTRKPLAKLNVGPPVYAVAFSPDGRSLASTGPGSTARLWNVTSRRPVATLTGRSGTITSQPTFADRHAFLRVDYDIQVPRWSTARPRTRPTPIHPPKSFATSVSSSNSVAVAGHDRRVRVWSLATGRHIATLPAGNGFMWQLAITPDGNTLAVGSDDGTIRVWDVATRRATAVLRGHRSVKALALRPDGHALAAIRSDGTTYLWTTRSGQAASPMSGPKNADMALAFSPDGGRLAAGNDDGTIRVWDIATRRTFSVLRGHTGPILGVDFSPDHVTLAATYINDGSVQLWDYHDPRLHATLTDPTLEEGQPKAVFSPNGQALATFTPNGARVWSTDTGYVATRVCRLSSDHHWAQLLPDQPVKDVCDPHRLSATVHRRDTLAVRLTAPVAGLSRRTRHSHEAR